jgi:hypothetical protein
MMSSWEFSNENGGAPSMRILVFLQGAYYLTTGLWPIVGMRSFEAVTGPKTDDWLVRMVGLLAAAIGATLLVGVMRGPDRQTLTLAVLSAISFAAIDVIYALNGTISRIYLADAVIQAIAVTMVLATSRKARQRNR